MSIKLLPDPVDAVLDFRILPTRLKTDDLPTVRVTDGRIAAPRRADTFHLISPAAAAVGPMNSFLSQGRLP